MPEALSIKYIGGNQEAGNVVVVETRAPEGHCLQSHRHKHAHTSVLVSGKARLIVDGEESEIEGYCLVTIPAGTSHEVQALTDIIWLCLWSGELAPVDEIRDSLNLAPTSERTCSDCPAGCTLD